MKKASELTKHIVAILLSGMLVVGTIQGTSLAAEVQENNVQEEEAITTYTVTLDANGGYFVNEWDDVLGKTVEFSEVLNKIIPVGKAVTTFPVMEQENTVVSFVGWSLERDGEIISQGYEEYLPVENCVLYAVWNVDGGAMESESSAEDTVGEESDNQHEKSVNTKDQDTEFTDDSTEQTAGSGKDIPQESEDTNSEDIYVEDDAASEAKTVSEIEKDKNETSDQQDIEHGQETIDAEKNEQEKSVREDAAMGVAASGACGTNLTWTLDEEGTLTISGTGKMSDYSTNKCSPWYKYRSFIKKAIITDGVTCIGSSAFEDCDGINSIEIAEGLKSIGEWAFSKCESLSNIIIPESVNSIAKCSFWGSGLISITFPDNVTIIGDCAFENCKRLETVQISMNVTSIGTAAFSSCSNLKSINVDAYNTTYMSIGGVLFDKKRKSLLNFPGGKSGSYTLPEGIVNIDNHAFSDCTNLTSIDIPEGVESIGDYAFEDCTGLTNITFPGSLTSIGSYAFHRCKSLSSVLLPKKVKSLGDNAFSCCDSLESITLPDRLITIEAGTFYGCSRLKSATIPGSVISIGAFAFDDCDSLTSITLMNGLTEIKDYAFRECINLKSITIPESVRSIGICGFALCSNLKTIYFTGSVTSINTNAFADVTATAYYPANDPTWTEDVRQNYGGTITWVTYDNTAPIVTPDPANFSLIIGTPNNALVIGEDAQSSALAYYNFTNQNTALEEARQINWTCSDASAVEIDNPVYILETKAVRISFSLRGKKPGLYTLTGTTPDGRSTSADVVVEPKIIAVSNNTTISETTDVVMVQTTLSTGDRTYLTNFLNQISCRIKDDYGTIGGADSKRVEVSEDGKIGRLIYTLTPVYAGSCEFTLMSPGGQKIVEKIYTGLSNYPWSNTFSIPDDTWNFNNYSAVPIPIQSAEYNKLVNGMDRTLKKYIDEKIATAGITGQCYGLAATSILVDKGGLALSEIQDGITTLNQANDSDNAKSIIGLYFLGQYTDEHIRHEEEFLPLPVSAQLERIENSSFPILLSFGSKSLGGHAVVGYGIETGFWNIRHNPGGSIEYNAALFGTMYDRRLLVYDSNRIANTHPEGSYLYYNSDTFEWEIPNYYDNGLSSKKNGYLRRALDDKSVIAKVNSSAFFVKGMKLRSEARDGFIIENSTGSYNITGETVRKDFSCFYSDTGDNETSKDFNIYFKNNTNLTVKPIVNESADFSLVTPDFYYDINAHTYTSATFGVSGEVSAKGIEGEYTFEITLNEQSSAIPYYTLIVEGNDAGDISIDLQDDGLHISGDNLENVTVTGENDNTTKELDFSTDVEEVLIIGDENGLQGLIDLNGDDVFDKEEQVFPVQIIKEGKCSESVSWELDITGKLTISGTGAIPDYLMDMTPRAPWLNENVKRVVIGKGITRIGNYSFYGMTSLAGAKLPSTLTQIGWGAFQDCKNLKTVNIPAGVELIDGIAFHGTAWLAEKREQNPYVIINGILIDGETVSGNEIDIPENVKKIGPYAFVNKVKYTSVNIPEGVESIGNIAFSGNNTLSSVFIPSTVNEIGTDAFDDWKIAEVQFGGTPSQWEKLGISSDNNYSLYTADKKSFTRIDITKAAVTGLVSKTYTSKAITQTPTVEIDSTTLKQNTDYKISYKNNTNAGTATITITGIGDYTETVSRTFIIARAAQSLSAKASAASVAVGKTITMTASGAKETSDYSYTSSNTKVATVSTKGVVTGKSAGTVTITVKTPQTQNYNAASKTVKITVTANKSLKKPGNCHFAKWDNAKYTSCQIAWNKVAGAEGYQTLLSWTNGTHASATIVKSNVLYRNCTVHPQHVSQMKVRAFYTLGGKRVFGPWSNIEYITPSPTKLTTKNVSNGSNLKMNISWNIIYGCNGYNVFITTNPNGKWYWNQSTSEKATATSATIDKCGGAKLKKNSRYYVRIVTRRKRNGVFCTVPMPASNTYVGSFIIK